MQVFTVLLVEDHAMLRAFYREVIEDDGHRVLECASGEDALTICAQAAVHAVIADLRLDGSLSGLDLLGHVAEQSPSIGKVLISGASHPPETMPADIVFLSKPFSGESLLQALAAVTKVNGSVIP